MQSPFHDEVLAGVGRTDITPPGECQLAGFAAREHAAEGIHDPLTATALAISKDDKTVVLVALDLIDMPDSLMEKLWKQCSSRFRLEPHQLMVNCSHTHAGPILDEVLYLQKSSGSVSTFPDREYIERLIELIAEAIGTALGNQKPACARRGFGKTYIGINRRARDTGINAASIVTDFGIYPYPKGKVDRTCPVIMLNDSDGNPLALLFGASCHPTTMKHNNYLISAEYPGVARKILEKDLGGAPALFIQGISGDVKPRQVAGKNGFRHGTFEDIEAVGRELAADVKKILAKNLNPLYFAIKSSLKRFQFPFADGWDEGKYRELASEDEPEYHRIWARRWLDVITSGEKVPGSLGVTLSLMELSPDLRFAGIAGELLTGMGMKLKGLFREGVTLPLSYSNGSSSYIPDSTVITEGGYEGLEAVFFSPEMSAPWRDDIDDTFLNAFEELERTMQ